MILNYSDRYNGEMYPHWLCQMSEGPATKFLILIISNGLETGVLG